MPTLTPKIETPLPPGWSASEWKERRKALALLTPLVRKTLALAWASRALEDARRVLPIFEQRFPHDDRPRKAIEAGEKVVKTGNAVDAADAADAAANAAANAAVDAANAANAAANAADAAANAADAAANAAYAAANAAYATANAADAAYATANAVDAADAAYAAADAADAAADAAASASKLRWRWIHATYKHARGPAFAFNPAWRTSDTIALARGIYDDHAFERMPILADALQDAGMDDIESILHLQNDGDEWTRADWWVVNLLQLDRGD